MEFAFLFLFLGFTACDMILSYSMQKRLDETTKKYNDLRVQYASLKSKRGIQDENN